MRINKQTFQMVELDGVTDRLKEHPRNPKRGNVAAIHESIDVNGFFGAVLAQESTGYILAGNHTYRTAQQKKAKEVPVLWIDVDDETALRILLADNKIAELGFMDEAALDSILEELPGLEGTGYSAQVEEAIEQNETPAEAEPPGADDVPDDEFESQYGVVVLCEDAEHQQEIYLLLQALSEGNDFKGAALDEDTEAMDIVRRIQLRVVAI